MIDLLTNAFRHYGDLLAWGAAILYGGGVVLMGIALWGLID
jgi:hypothetical protein